MLARKEFQMCQVREGLTSVSPSPFMTSDSYPKNQDRKYDTHGTWPLVGTGRVNE